MSYYVIKFWTGLFSDVLKLQTRHKYDFITDYNVLREIEISKPVSSTRKKKIGHNPVSADEFTSLSARIDLLESWFC